MSQESLNQPMQTPVSVNLKLVPSNTSNFPTLQRVLYEKEFLKIGRQVKSAEEKAAALSSQANPATQAEVEPETPDAPAAFFQNAAPEEQKPQHTSQPDPVWFKSKVVSRIHAEIWLKDGQVASLT